MLKGFAHFSLFGDADSLGNRAVLHKEVREVRSQILRCQRSQVFAEGVRQGRVRRLPEVQRQVCRGEAEGDGIGLADSRRWILNKLMEKEWTVPYFPAKWPFLWLKMLSGG